MDGVRDGLAMEDLLLQHLSVERESDVVAVR